MLFVSNIFNEKKDFTMSDTFAPNDSFGWKFSPLTRL